MIRIHVSLDLEHESGHARLVRVDLARIGSLRTRGRRKTGKRIEQVLDAEILQGRAEEYRRQIPFAERGKVELTAGFLDQRQFLGDGRGIEQRILRR